MHIHTPFPVAEPTLSQLVTWLHTKSLSGGTAKNYLCSSCRHTQIALGPGNQNMGQMPQLEYVVWGMKRTAKAQTRTWLPITPESLEGMRQVWQKHPNSRDAAMPWAAATMCFFGFMRSGEVVPPSESSFDSSVHQAHGDVRVNSLQATQFIEV